jgi:hypothetical protein
MPRLTYLTAATVLLALISLAGSAAGLALGLVWPLLIGTTAVVFARLVNTYNEDAPGRATPMMIAGVSVLLAVLIKWLSGSSSSGWQDGAALLFAPGTAWIAEVMLASGATRPCTVCKLPMQDQSALTCPRCEQSVCTRPTCWVARHLRCRYCHEREVIAFPTDERWWSARTGRRVANGSCSSCYKESTDADLRECQQCHWPMCRRCWDYHNGQCTRCKWIIPELPRVLHNVMNGRAASENRVLNRLRGGATSDATVPGLLRHARRGEALRR